MPASPPRQDRPAPPPGTPPHRIVTGLAGLLGTAGVLAVAGLALLQPLPAPRPSKGPSAALADLACPLGKAGLLRGRFFGALALDADWSGPALSCDGMQKPAGQGVRLYFAGNGPDGGRVALLIGLEGIVDDLAGAERPANVTVIDERASRFFSSAGPGRCWATIRSVTPVDTGPRDTAGKRVDGLVYCVGALPSVGDRSSLTLGDLEFSGWVSSHAD